MRVGVFIRKCPCQDSFNLVKVEGTENINFLYVQIPECPCRDLNPGFRRSPLSQKATASTPCCSRASTDIDSATSPRMLVNQFERAVSLTTRLQGQLIWLN